MKSSCETCITFDHQDEDCEEYCRPSNYIYWQPKDQTYCEGCRMWGHLARGRWKCCRHAEPCFRDERWEE